MRRAVVLVAGATLIAFVSSARGVSWKTVAKLFGCGCGNTVTYGKTRPGTETSEVEQEKDEIHKKKK